MSLEIDFIKKIPMPLILLCGLFLIIPNFLDEYPQYYIEDLAWFLLLLPCFIFSYYLGAYGGIFTGIIVNAYHLSWFFYEKKFHSEEVMDESAALHIGISIITLSCSIGVGLLSEKLKKNQMKIQELNGKLMHMALYDALTGLPNRYYFVEKVTDYLKKKEQISLMFIDLDGFKKVNDHYGHEAGDEVLKEVSQKLTLLQDDDTFVSRLGGDEFTVLVKGANVNQIKEKARHVLHLLQIKFQGLPISGSIGIAICHDEDTPASILKTADTAMYQAKLAGKNTIFFLDKKDAV